MNQTWENGKKQVSGLSLASLAQIPPRPQFFSVTRYHGQLSSCTTSEKNNDPILRKRTDGQTDENDLIGRRSANVERPTKNIFPCFETGVLYT